MPLESGSRLGRYEIHALIGAGGMGEVYHARDTHLGREVAIKVLPSNVADSPTRRARFEREGQAISRLNHANICSLYDVGEQEGVAFLVMEYIKGESLEQRLRLGPLPWAAALQAAIQVAAAVDAAHSVGVVHRDLKPANIMLTESTVKLLDFGVAKLLAKPDDGVAVETRSLTSEHKVVGTINYMAPEQLERREVDPRTDIFAFGAVLYEMLTGRKAFDGASQASVTAAILTTEPRPVSSSAAQHDVIVPQTLDHVVQRALAKNPNERWQTARDVMHELQWILDGPSQESNRTVNRSWRRGLGLAIAGLVLLAGGAALGWIGRRPQMTKTPPVSMFTVEPPPGTTLGPGFGKLAVSPDGLKIAFIASADGTPSLWIRYLNDLNPHRLLGTEGANGPFWSPDSQSIAFFAGGRIERIDVGGGQPTTVVEWQSAGPLTLTEAGCWMPDNTIVYAQKGGLYRVPATTTGATPVLAVATDESRNEQAFMLPTPLNPQEFLYLVRRNSAEMTESQVGGRKGAVVRLESVRSNAELAAGYLIFRQRNGSTLVAQPFDQRGLDLAGQPVLLAEGVEYNPGNGRTVFSASPNVLAYHPDTPRQLTWIDRTGHRLRVIGEVGRDRNPAVSHDGSTVAVDRFDPTRPRFQLWKIDEQGQSTALTHGVTERFSVWSWDGKWIAFSRAGLKGAEMYQTLASGQGQEELLFKTGQPAIPLDWSRDGDSLVYESAGDYWVLSLNDHTTRQFTNSRKAGATARLSADGKWLAYTVIDNGARSVWVQEFPGGSVPHRVSDEEGFDPNWRGDGRELYYITSAGDLKAVAVTAGNTLTFGPPVKLFAFTPGAIHTPLHVYSPTPDGQRFLVSEQVPDEPGIVVVQNWQALVR